MSKRNSQEAKRAARERLRAERERQAKREKIRRQLTVGGVTVAVLALAAGIAYGVTKLTEESAEVKAWKAAKKEKLVKPDNTADVNGTTIVIGDEDAPTLEIYEDPRCPVCASFEQNTGETVRKDIENGKYKVSFTFGTFIDEIDQIKGTGSKNAVSALGAALDVSEDAFLDYKSKLFSAKYHPPEPEDKFADDDYLLDVAQDVKELKGNKSFEKNVKNGTFDRWALEMSDKYEKSPVRGTPAFRMFGETLEIEGAREGAPITTPAQLNAVVNKALAAQDDKGEDEDAQDDKGKDAKDDKAGEDDARKDDENADASAEPSEEEPATE